LWDIIKGKVGVYEIKADKNMSFNQYQEILN